MFDFSDSTKTSIYTFQKTGSKFFTSKCGMDQTYEEVGYDTIL